MRRFEPTLNEAPAAPVYTPFPECFGVAEDTLREERMAMRRSATSWGIGSALAVLSVAALAWYAWHRPANFTDALETVEQRLGHRLLPGRLTEVEHAPYPVQRGGEGPGGLDEIEAQNLVELGTVIRSSSSEVEVRVAQGLLKIATGGNEADLTKVIDDLEAKAVSRSDDPALLNHLAALTLGRAIDFGQPQDLLAAFELADRALTLQPDLAPALFNKALALEELSLTSLAEAAWTDYLELDEQSGWADEARERRDDLRLKEPAPSWKNLRPQVEKSALSDRAGLSKLLSPYRAEAVGYVENDLIAKWLASLESDPDEADRLLKIGREVATALSDLTLDPYAADVMAAIDGPGTVVAGAADRRAVIDAHRFYIEAQTVLNASDVEAARGLLEEARNKLAKIGSPLYLKALFDLAKAERNAQRYPEARALLAEIIADPKARTYPLLWGDVHWILALTVGDTGHPERALDIYRTALETFQNSGDVNRYTGIQNMIADVLDALGRSREGWRYRANALRQVDSLPSPLRANQTYAGAAVAAWQEGYPTMALAFEDMAESSARKVENDALPVAVSLIWRGRMLIAIGELEGARASLDEARGRLDQVHPKNFQAEASLLTAQGELLIDDDPRETVQLMTDAIEIYRDGQQFWLASALVTRSLAYLKLGEIEAAAADLDDCISEYEKTRGEMLSREERISFFEKALRNFNELTKLQLRQGDFAAALATADERRGRSLLDAFLRTTALTPPVGGQPAAELLPVEEIQASIPADAALLEYTHLSDGWWVGVVRRAALDWVELPVAAADLEARVMKFQSDVSTASGADEIRAAGEPLYRALIAPAARHLAGVGHLVIVPDGVLHALPFDALTHPENGRLVVQDYRVSVAASANLYARSRQRDAELATAGRLAPLVVGNPAFDNARFLMRDLPGAESEARRVARIYDVADPLIGFKATKERFLELAAEAPLIHFGGHAVPNHQAPGRSYLLLAPAAGSDDSGALYSQEISALHLPRTRLVVLAACSTASGQTLRGEGVFSLAYAFQSAGVPGVIASLWDVDDRITAELLRRLHQRIADGESADAALRDAKISMIEPDDEELEGSKDFGRPAAWAAFQVFGEANFHPQGGKQNGL